MLNETINHVALAALLHDIGKFAQRADAYSLKNSIYKQKEYKYSHAAYTAQALEELGFNLGVEMNDASAMHHHPQNELHWIIAAADRMASGFERERFEAYNSADSESFKQQRLWHLFDEKRQFRIDTLTPSHIFPENEKAVVNEYDALWKQFIDDFAQIQKEGNAVVDSFTIDYLLQKYTSFIPSSTSFEKGGYKAVKANIPLYEHSKATAAFASALYALHVTGNDNIVRYYQNAPCDIEQSDLLIISGDFFGIQRFIFDSVPAAKASKILRAKSAYVQLLIKVVALEIVERLGLSYQSILSTHAGKFEILAINTPQTLQTLEVLQKELDSFFIEKYFGETGIGISHTLCSLADFIEQDRYQKSLRSRITDAVEASKFRKFNLLHVDPVLDYDEGIDNQNLCQLCNKKKGRAREENDKNYTACDDCQLFVDLGRRLADSEYLVFSREKGQMKLFGAFYLSFVPKGSKPELYKKYDIAIFDIARSDTFRGYAKWELSSYVAREAQEVLTFEELAERSCSGSDTGIEAIMSLKGDVDNMGAYIKNSDVTRSFARYNFFARMMDYFFSAYAPSLMRGRNLYTVFAGGDDIFVLGAWDEVIDFTKKLREEFMRFAAGSELTLSVGMVLVKPNKPINFVAQMVEVAEMKAKNFKPTQSDQEKEKNAVALFNEVIGWEDYLDMYDEFHHKILPAASRYPSYFGTAFWYRLLEFCDMADRVKNRGDIEATMWKSKLRYSFSRNILEPTKDESLESVYQSLHELIESYDASFKMILMEYLYQRRERS